MKEAAPRAHIEITADAARVTAKIPAEGIEVAVDAAVALVVEGKGVTLSAVGEEATTLAARLPAIERAHPEIAQPRHRVVEAARWWRAGPNAGVVGGMSLADFQHEVMIVWPLRPEVAAPEVGAMLLAHVASRAKLASRSWRWRAWPVWRPRVAITLRGWPDAPALHDDLVRVLWGYLGVGRVVLNGRPARLLQPRTWRELSWREWLDVAKTPAAAALVLVATPWRTGVSPPAWLIMLFSAMGLLGAVSEYRRLMRL